MSQQQRRQQEEVVENIWLHLVGSNVSGTCAATNFISNAELSKALLLWAACNPVSAKKASSLTAALGGYVLDPQLEAQRFSTIIAYHPSNPFGHANNTNAEFSGTRKRKPAAAAPGLGVKEFSWALQQPELRAMLGIGSSLARALQVIDFFLSAGKTSGADPKQQFSLLPFTAKKYLICVMEVLGLGDGNQKAGGGFLPSQALCLTPRPALEAAIRRVQNSSSVSAQTHSHLFGLSSMFWPGSPALSTQSFLVQDPATVSLVASKSTTAIQDSGSSTPAASQQPAAATAGATGRWIEERRSFNPLVEAMQGPQVLSDGLAEAYVKSTFSTGAKATHTGPGGSILCYWSLMHRAALVLLDAQGEEQVLTLVYSFVSEHFTETGTSAHGGASGMVASPSTLGGPSNSLLFGSPISSPAGGIGGNFVTFPPSFGSGSSNVTAAALASFFSGLSGFGTPVASTSDRRKTDEEGVRCFQTLISRLTEPAFLCRITGTAQPGHSIRRHGLQGLLLAEDFPLAQAPSSTTSSVSAQRWKEVPRQGQPIRGVAPVATAASDAAYANANSVVREVHIGAALLNPLGVGGNKGRLGLKLSDCLALSLAWAFHGHAVEAAWRSAQSSSSGLSTPGRGALPPTRSIFPRKPFKLAQSQAHTRMEQDQLHVLSYVSCLEPDHSNNTPAGGVAQTKGPGNVLKTDVQLSSSGNPLEDFGGGFMHCGDSLLQRASNNVSVGGQKPKASAGVVQGGQRYTLTSIAPSQVAKDAAAVAQAGRHGLVTPASVAPLVAERERNRQPASDRGDGIPLDDFDAEEGDGHSADDDGDNNPASTVATAGGDQAGRTSASRPGAAPNTVSASAWGNLLEKSLMSSVHALHCSSMLSTTMVLGKESLANTTSTPGAMVKSVELLYPLPVVSATELCSPPASTGQASVLPPGMSRKEDGTLQVDDQDDRLNSKALDNPLGFRPSSVHALLHQTYSLSDYVKSLGIAAGTALETRTIERQAAQAAASPLMDDGTSSIATTTITTIPGGMAGVSTQDAVPTDYETVSASVKYMLASKQKLRAEQVSRRHRLQEKMRVLRSMCQRDGFLRTELAHLAENLDLSEVQTRSSKSTSNSDLEKLKGLATKKQELVDRKEKANSEIDRCRHITKTLTTTRTELLEEVSDLKVKMKRAYNQKHSVVQSQLDDHARELAQTLRAEQSVVSDRTKAVNLSITSMEGPQRSQLYDYYDKKIASIEKEKTRAQKQLDMAKADLVRVTLSPIGKWRKW